MLLLGFILLPAVLASVRELHVDNFVVKIRGDNLHSIHPTSESCDKLVLSNLGLKGIDDNAFEHVSDLKTLDLSDNSISDIPKRVFENLSNLEQLNLANNGISRLDNAFVGLKCLKTLNLEKNPLKILEKGSLYGLSKSTNVLLCCGAVSVINTAAFEKPSLVEVTTTEISVEEAHRRVGFTYDPAVLGPSALTTGKPPSKDDNSHSVITNPRVKVCIVHGKLKSVEAVNKHASLGAHCKRVIVENGKLSLRGLGISSFEKNWYNPQGLAISAIDLDENAIVRVTCELLNDLPAGVKEVTIRKNRIECLESGIIVNQHLSSLDLSDNLISEIAAGALENTNLDAVYLDGNRLKSTKCAATLPASVTKLHLRDNEINEVPVDSFAGLAKLSVLKLDGNNITAIQRQSLRGIPALRFLTLSNNGLHSIEPFAFEAQTFLRVLDLSNNRMSSIHKDLFTGLEILLTLNISGNCFTKITPHTMAGLPYTVHSLYLGYNGIESLNAQSFVNVPILDLSLDGNKISKIAKGTFSLPYLRSLSLKDNKLGEFNGDSFEGLSSLKTLSLAGNGITRIQKGALKHLGSLNVLDISNNPIEKLKNGALYGLQKSESRFVNVINTPLKKIQSGVFDDVI